MSQKISYSSTNRNSPEVSFREALLKGLAPDGGLYMPGRVPALQKNELEGFRKMHYSDIACAVLRKYLGEEISAVELLSICRDAYSFDVPLERMEGKKYVMRLDNGPTASFKDFAARIMSRLMQYYLSREDRHLTILTATSGDTGSAVASAFHGLTNIDVVILFPVAEVSVTQRRQMTTLGRNISVLAIDGKFDDCQRLVKEAFTDKDLSHIPLSSANSINIGRLLPQSVYYIYAWSRLAQSIGEKAIFSVPSGNFGNLMGGLLAREMGLPVDKFIVATNMNNEVPEFLRTGIYTPISPSLRCISNAMNVGHPSNLARIVALYGGVMDETGKILANPDIGKMRSDLRGYFVSDEDTASAIEGAWSKYNTILEPHGAVAWEAIDRYVSASGGNDAGQLFISLETAHPSKFEDEIRKIINVVPPVPASIKALEGKKESCRTIPGNYAALKEYILEYHSK